MKKKYIFGIVALIILVALIAIFQEGKEPEEIVYSQEIQNNLKVLEQVKEQAKIDALKPKIPKTFDNVEPYTEPLPPIPDQELNDSTLFGIDFNDNGVRDDLEHWIVNEFWKDKMVVESFFAFVRSDALNLKIQEKWLFTDDLYENNIKLRSTLSYGCRWKYLNNSAFWLNTTESYLLALDFEKKMDNTKNRKKVANNFFSNLDNKFWISRSVSEEECKEFFEETKLYIY